ncbi:MAG: SH3 domain-containing protein [Rhodopila sp.]
MLQVRRILVSVAPVIAGAVVFGCGPSGWMVPARAQTGSLLGGAAHPAPEQPVKPPSPAPRQPVHQDAPRQQPAHQEGHAGKAPPVAPPPAAHPVASPASPPVVPPRGPTHPHKPRGAAPVPAPAKPAPVEAPPSIPSTPPAPAAESTPEPEKPDGSPAKLPRFASLRSDEVNMRAGPGLRYRIDWVYKRRDLPVEILREFDVWRWVRDPDGIEGWMQQATLMGRRSFIVQKADATLRAEPNDTAAAVAVLKPGVIGRIRSCEAASAWCNVQTGSYRGYLRREQFWGVFPGEAVNP